MRFNVELYRLARIHAVTVDAPNMDEAIVMAMPTFEEVGKMQGYVLKGLTVKVKHVGEHTARKFVTL